MRQPSYVPSFYRLPSSDKEYLCTTSKDNGLHKCQDLPALRSAEFTKICRNDIPPNYIPSQPLRKVESKNGSKQLIIHEERFVDGKLVPYDLVPGDEDSPYLLKQLSPLVAQSVFQPAYAPKNQDTLLFSRQRRQVEDSSTSQSNIKSNTTIRKERIKSTSNRFFRMIESDDIGNKLKQIQKSQLFETNENSDSFEKDESLLKRRKKQIKGNCINWNKYYTECKAGNLNPFQGTISFDNVGMAWTAIFLVISLEGWSDIMYLLQDSHSFWVWTYFVLLIVIGSFFMINLCLVVIATQFSATKKREMERMRQERLKSCSSSTLAASNESANCYRVIIRSIANIMRRTKRILVNKLKRRKLRMMQQELSVDKQNSGQPIRSYLARSSIDIETATQDSNLVCSNTTATDDGKLRENKQISQYKSDANFSHYQRSILQVQPIEYNTSLKKSSKLKTARRSRRHHDRDLDEIEIHFWPKFIRRNKTLIKIKKIYIDRVRKTVDHRYFQRVILLAILINTVSMGIEYHDQPQKLTEIVEISNILFAILFLIEMILKLSAHGFYAYIYDGFNCFDGCVVLLSIMELFESSGSGLSVLRTFRLLRILKLVRFMPALRRQLLIMLKTVDNVAVFFGLLGLFIFIFAVLGMNLFGCKFCETLPDKTERCDRKNFNSLLWSLVTVFQILTQEDWNVVLFNGMEKTSHWAALYFVLLMTFGNYVLFNLLVAILVEGFSQEDDSKSSSTVVNKDGSRKSDGQLVPISNFQSDPVLKDNFHKYLENQSQNQEKEFNSKLSVFRGVKQQSDLSLNKQKTSEAASDCNKSNLSRSFIQHKNKILFDSGLKCMTSEPKTVLPCSDIRHVVDMNKSPVVNCSSNHTSQNKMNGSKCEDQQESINNNECHILGRHDYNGDESSMLSKQQDGNCPRSMKKSTSFIESYMEEKQRNNGKGKIAVEGIKRCSLAEDHNHPRKTLTCKNKMACGSGDESCINIGSNKNAAPGSLLFVHQPSDRLVNGEKNSNAFKNIKKQLDTGMIDAEQFAIVSNTYFGFRRHPKRLIYFGDSKDDIDSEIKFLTHSLKTKSYAVSVASRTDKYLGTIAKMQVDIPQTIDDNQYYYYYQTDTCKNSKIVKNAHTNNSEDYSNNDIFNDYASTKLRLSGSKGSNSSYNNKYHPNTVGNCNINQKSLRIGPFWSSIPCYLNADSIKLSHIYQMSFSDSNDDEGREDRMMAYKGGKFDKASCRVFNLKRFEQTMESFKVSCIAYEATLNSPESVTQKKTKNNDKRSNSYAGGVTSNKQDDLNMSSIYEPFKFFPAFGMMPYASRLQEVERNHSLTSSCQTETNQDNSPDIAKIKPFNLEVIKSLQNYSEAVTGFDQIPRKCSTIKQSEDINQAQTTTHTSSRKDSIIVRSKLKFLCKQSNNENSCQSSSANLKHIPRLSLTQPEPEKNSDVNSPIFQPPDLSAKSVDRLSLGNSTDNIRKSHTDKLSQYYNCTTLAPRHSIADLPNRNSNKWFADFNLGSVNGDKQACRPLSTEPQGRFLASQHKPRPSFVSWLQSNRERINRQSLTTNGSSFMSHSSRLYPYRFSRFKRRRSFSGPLEWFKHESHCDDLMQDTSKSFKKRRLKKMKQQKSSSSDYHSLNNQRVYKLDARGIQTSLKGVFYVINKDPLALCNQQTSRTNGDTDAAVAVGMCVNQPMSYEKEESVSKELNSSFFETSDFSNNQKQLNTNSSIENTIAKNQKSRTFFYYFHWTPWMIQRRHYSLFIFSPQSKVRRFCNMIINRKEFDYFVLFFISMNCVTLAMERPNIPPWSQEREFLTVANYYFTFMFTLEMVLKVIAKNLYYGKDAYFSDNWNIMDGGLVGFSLFDLILSIIADKSPRIFGILRVFRLLRSLRPLRVINRLMGLKLVVQTLLLSLRPIGNIVLICCTFFIIFGVLGVQLFKGTFYYCDGPDPLNIMRSVRTKEDCISDNRNRWINRKYNFDNLGQALMALFVLSSKDGWVNIMYTGIDAVGIDMQPRENYNEWRMLYFISFLLLVAFFVLNMFVGVVVENFHRCRKEQELEEKARRAEKRQRKLDKRRRKLREPPYFSNYGRWRSLLHRWVTGGYFDLMIAAVIGFNVVFMSLEHYQMPENLIHVLKVSNYVFTVAFILEAAIKTTALGLRRYMRDRWNQLDVAIVVMSVIGIVFEEMDSFTLPINPTLLRVLRVMRIARVLKLLKMAKGIRALLDTVMQALPQVGNLGLLFFLLFFIFAALGVELFGRLECNEEYPCSGLMDQHAHFQNFGLAFLTLFRVATGDNWNGIMKDTLRDKCDPSSKCLKNCCVSQIIAPLYFVVFVLLAQFVLVNVVVAVLMKHLEESHQEMEIDEEYELDKQLAEELDARKKALIEARKRLRAYRI